MLQFYLDSYWKGDDDGKRKRMNMRIDRTGLTKFHSKFLAPLHWNPNFVNSADLMRVKEVKGWVMAMANIHTTYADTGGPFWVCQSSGRWAMRGSPRL